MSLSVAIVDEALVSGAVWAIGGKFQETRSLYSHWVWIEESEGLVP